MSLLLISQNKHYTHIECVGTGWMNSKYKWITFLLSFIYLISVIFNHHKCNCIRQQIWNPCNRFNAISLHIQTAKWRRKKNHHSTINEYNKRKNKKKQKNAQQQKVKIFFRKSVVLNVTLHYLMVISAVCILCTFQLDFILSLHYFFFFLFHFAQSDALEYYAD